MNHFSKAILAYNNFFAIECEKDDKKAEEFCLLACSEGSKLALGMRYLFGWQSLTKFNTAFEIFNQICEENDKENKELKYALFLLGRCYHNGHGNVNLFLLNFFLHLIFYFFGTFRNRKKY